MVGFFLQWSDHGQQWSVSLRFVKSDFHRAFFGITLSVNDIGIHIINDWYHIIARCPSRVSTSSCPALPLLYPGVALSIGDKQIAMRDISNIFLFWGLTNSIPPRAMTVPELTKEMFDAKNMMTACDPRYGRFDKCSTLSLTIIIVRVSLHQLIIIISRQKTYHHLQFLLPIKKHHHQVSSPSP